VIATITSVFELLTFRVAGTDDVWLAAESRVQTESAYHQPGFLRRMVGRADDGRWLVIQMWASPDEAVAGSAAIASSAAGTDWSSLVTDLEIERFVGA
jgi:hypothetical protein